MMTTEPAPDVGADKEELLVAACLANFSATMDEYTVNERIAIGGKTFSQVVEQIGRAAPVGSEMRLALEGCRFAISFVVDVTSKPDYTYLPSAEHIVTCLRLIKSGDVYCPLVLEINPKTGEVRQRSRTDWSLRRGEPYRMTKADGRLLEQILVNTRAPRLSDRKLVLALDRFSAAYDRWRMEDKIIDFWIALEALFLPDGRDELRFRGALRIARYVAQSPDERLDIYRQMTRSYSCRSTIVHGGTLESALLGQTVQQTEEIVRRALRRLILHPGSLNHRELDDAAVQGE